MRCMDAACRNLMTTTCLACWLRPSTPALRSKFKRPAAVGSRKSRRSKQEAATSPSKKEPPPVPREEEDIHPHRRDHPYSVSFSGHVPPEAFCPMGAFGWRAPGEPASAIEWKVAPRSAPIVVAGAPNTTRSSKDADAKSSSSSSGRRRGGRKGKKRTAVESEESASAEPEAKRQRAAEEEATALSEAEAAAVAAAAELTGEAIAARRAKHWWDVNEEFMLLEAIERHGLGNWKAAAEEVSCCALRAGLGSDSVARIQAAALTLGAPSTHPAVAVAAGAGGGGGGGGDQPSFPAWSIAWQRRLALARLKGARDCADHFTRVWIDGGCDRAAEAWGTGAAAAGGDGAAPPTVAGGASAAALPPPAVATFALHPAAAAFSAAASSSATDAVIGASALVKGFSHMRDDFTDEWCDSAESSLGMEMMTLSPEEVGAYARSLRLAASASGRSKSATAAAVAAAAASESPEERALREQVALKLRTIQQYEAIVREREVRKSWLRETGMVSLAADRVEINVSASPRRPHRKGFAAAAAAATVAAAVKHEVQAQKIQLAASSVQARGVRTAPVVSAVGAAKSECPSRLAIPPLPQHSASAAAALTSATSSAAAFAGDDTGEDMFWRFSRIRDLVQRSAKRQRTPSSGGASPRASFGGKGKGSDDGIIQDLLQSVDRHDTAQERLCSVVLPLARFVSPSAYEDLSTGLQVRLLSHSLSLSLSYTRHCICRLAFLLTALPLSRNDLSHTPLFSFLSARACSALAHC